MPTPRALKTHTLDFFMQICEGVLRPSKPVNFGSGGLERCCKDGLCAKERIKPIPIFESLLR